MSPLALSLVIASALFHAVWNLHAKQSEDKLLFLWGMLCVGSLLFLPVLIVGPWPNLPQQGWGYILGSGAIHAAYYFFLAEAYKRGDLSLVYPLARGSSPLLVVEGGIWSAEICRFGPRCGGVGGDWPLGVKARNVSCGLVSPSPIMGSHGEKESCEAAVLRNLVLPLGTVPEEGSLLVESKGCGERLGSKPGGDRGEITGDHQRGCDRLRPPGGG
ncbi:MAG: hypothetical protein V3U42_01650 [candidate division NC10 bacterium]